MIRAGRRHLVRTLADLAAERGVTRRSYLNRKDYRADDFPAPVSSPDAQTLLYDAEQTDAYYAGDPVPALPEQDDDADLLDKHEASAALSRPVSPRSWDVYKKDAALADHMVRAGGVEHWPRGVVRAWDQARPGPGTGAGGRPRRSGDQVPRDEMPARIQALLDADPAITAATAADQLGVHEWTAQHALSFARADRIAERLAGQPDLTPQQAAADLGYPAAAVRRAVALVPAQQRIREITPYLATVADALAAAGIPVTDGPHALVLDATAVAATLVLGPGAPVPALVWDERYGWYTSTSRRHPIPGQAHGEPPAGAGIRYLARSTTPEPDDVLAALRDRRKGSRTPRTARSGRIGQ
ncbi:DUF6292 family protein [Streptomyces sp. Ac-502]|uniref:DUF6292 family protein n=1 Tax=Streptomyces sp. Ac-502 TaxID=3342801 RepID=UPI003862D295